MRDGRRRVRRLVTPAMWGFVRSATPRRARGEGKGKIRLGRAVARGLPAAAAERCLMRPVRPLRIALFVVGLVLLACAPATQPAPQPAAPPPPVASPAAQAAPASGAASASGAPASGSAPARPTDAPLNPPATVRVGVVGATGESGLYIAEELGYFREQGIQIEWAQFQAGQQMIPLLGSGQLDVGSGGISAGLINAVALDIPLRIVADEGYIAPGSAWQGIVVRKELVDNGTFTGCPSYRGLRVANTTDGNTGQIVLARTLAECGLDADGRRRRAHELRRHDGRFPERRDRRRVHARAVHHPWRGGGTVRDEQEWRGCLPGPTGRGGALRTAVHRQPAGGRPAIHGRLSEGHARYTRPRSAGAEPGRSNRHPGRRHGREATRRCWTAWRRSI